MRFQNYEHRLTCSTLDAIMFQLSLIYNVAHEHSENYRSKRTKLLNLNSAENNKLSKNLM